MIYRNKFRTCLSLVFALMILGRITGDVMAAPVLSGMEIVASSRGTILSLTADAPFQCDVKRIATLKVKVFIPGCIYGLSEFTFSKFGKNAPIIALTAIDKSDGSGIELVLTLKNQPDEPFITRSKGVQQLILLSKQTESNFTWKAAPVESKKSAEGSIIDKKTGTPAADKQIDTFKGKENTDVSAKKTEPVQEKKTVAQSDKIENKNKTFASLNNIITLQRGDVCKLEFDFDKIVAGDIRHQGDSLIIVFSNAKNATGKKVFDIKPAMAYKRVLLEDSPKEEGKLSVTILIDKSVTDMSYTVAHQGNKDLSIYIIHRTEQRTALWTAAMGTQWEHEFTVLPYPDVDLEALEERALRDVSINLTSGPVFRIGESFTPAVSSDNSQADLKQADPKTETVVQKNSDDKPPTLQEQSVEKMKVENVVDKPVAQGPPASSDTVTLTVKNVNIRALPSMEGAVIGKGTSGVKAYRISTSSGWTQLYINGMTGWVSSQFVRDPVQTAVVASVQSSDDKNSDLSKDTSTAAVNNKLAQLNTVSNDSFAIQMVAQQLRVIENSQNDTLQSELKSSVVVYKTRGRDPFKPLVNDTVALSGKPVVENLVLVGLLIDGNDKIALLEDKARQRRPITLKENSAVEHGKVLKIYRDKVVFLLTEFGISRSYTIRLNRVESDQEVRVR